MVLDKSILLIDDDPRLLTLLRNFLTREGFNVVTATNGQEGLDQLSEQSFDLIVTDVMMPEMDGHSFLEEVRRSGSEIPVLMLTALGEVDDRIKGLSLGADDYLPKPFEPKELLLRIHNILKRVVTVPTLPVITFGDYLFDMANLQLTRHNTVVYLTPAESEILRLLGETFQKPVSREKIADALQSGGERSVDVQVVRLRKKIEADPSKPIYLKTIRHKGYVLTGGPDV